MLSAVQCDSLISLKGAFHSEGSIGRPNPELEKLTKAPTLQPFYCEFSTIVLGIIIEYMDRGSLEFLLDERQAVTELVMAGIVYQILWGLGYLHFDNRMVIALLTFTLDHFSLFDLLIFARISSISFLSLYQHRDIKPGNILIVSVCFYSKIFIFIYFYL